MEYIKRHIDKYLAEWKISSPENPLSEPVHNTALQHLIQFILIGGLPQVVATYAQTGRLYDCRQVLDDISAC